MFSTYAVYDIFKDDETVCTIPKTQRRIYTGISLLPENPDKMRGDILYVCSLSDALARNTDIPALHYVCFNDLSDDEAAALVSGQNGIYCLAGEQDLSRLFCQLQERFLCLSDWERRMTQAILRGCDFQALVDLSEDILKNPIFVQDAQLHLLATTQHYEGSSELQRNYQKTKYHTANFIRKLEDAGRFKRFNTTQGVIVSRDHLIEPFDIIQKFKHKAGMIVLTAGISCSVTPYSLYYQELAETFFDHIFLCDDHRSAVDKDASGQGTTLIRDLISGVLTESSFVADCARSFHLPFNGPFLLYNITWNQNEDLSRAHLDREFQEALGDIYTFCFSSELLLIESLESVSEPHPSRTRIETISSVCEAHHCKCTVSEPFPTLADLKSAYDQTGYTLRFIEDLLTDNGTNTLSPKSRERYAERFVYTYREVFLHCIFEHYAATGPCRVDTVLFVQALQRLIDFDRENDRDLVKILYYYICNERNAAKTGEQLYMSRNNVLYHIGNATRILDLSLDDHTTRFALLVAYHLLGIYF